MLSVRTVSIGILAAAAVALGAFVAGGDGGRALALSPTPTPFDFDWDVSFEAELVAGHENAVTVVANRVSKGFAPGQVKEPSYQITVEPVDGPVDVISPAKVTPKDVLDGASWGLVPFHDGEAELTFRLDYTLSYSITGTPPGAYAASDETTVTATVRVLLGDVSCDGAVDARDATLVLQWDAALLDALPCDAGDVTRDMRLNSRDATAILQYAVGLFPELEGVLAP